MKHHFNTLTIVVISDDVLTLKTFSGSLQETASAIWDESSQLPGDHHHHHHHHHHHQQEPPGLELFGHAPMYNAYNFSHVFKHGSRYYGS